MIIDATNLILGRFCTVAAKKALIGEEIHIVNCSKAVISGKKQIVLNKYKRIMRMGVPSKGPHLHRSSYRLVKRCIRGMLPYKQPRGRDALKRIKCYNNIPKVLKDKKIETIKNANVNKLPNFNFVKVGEISKLIGGKNE